MSVVDSLSSKFTTSSATAASSAKTEGVSEDRFLTLLVAQMKNQDPLNPLDNAQVTSQMAQISTVSGIEKLNSTMSGLNTQLVQLQAMQGASLVGRDVVAEGNRLAIAGGKGSASFELASSADRVQVEVLNAGGHVVDTLQLGAQGAGRHSFEWQATGVADGAAYQFRVLAKQGAASVGATALMHDRVTSVSAGGSSLTLELEHGGTVAYDKVKSFN